ncbi:MAG: helix-turn-helix transcriptional regulator [Lachnospiraceae bacterium]|nr:helix-turn-helix transcriptional regulator [Lachnospiraceae bacterium]
MDAAKTGKLIRELRTEKGLTQQELASSLMVSPTTVSKWENGRSLPDISMLEPLVKVLNVTFAEIILGERAEKAVQQEAQMGEEKAEEAIKSVIDESISQKAVRDRRTVRGIALIMLLLAAAVLLISWRHAYREQHRFSLDLTGLTDLGVRDPEEVSFILEGKIYLSHRSVQGEAFETFLKELEIASPAAIGKVVAFSYTPDGKTNYYYCTVDALPGDWLLMFREDGSGVPAANNALYLFGTKESIEKAP